jgi:uncharacterized protein YjbJ (UPF0337 family)
MDTGHRTGADGTRLARSRNGPARASNRSKDMNWNQVEGQWKQMGAAIKSRWAKLTDDDLQNLSAKKDMLVGKIEERYGIMKEEAEHQVDDWLDKLSARKTEKRPPKPM